jgi:integrase
VFDYAINNNLLQYNIVSSVKIPKGLPKNKRDPASREDEEKIKQSFDVWALPYIALYSGLRKGEILALQWQDIDFTEDLIDVYKSVAHKGDKPFIKDTKTKKGTRKVILLAPLKEKLLNYKKGKKSTEYVISDDGKKPLTNRRYITLMNDFHEKTGTSCTAHQLRHSFSTIAIESGVDAKIVQELLGHEQISTTLDIYTSVRKESLDKAKEILDKKFS